MKSYKKYKSKNIKNVRERQVLFFADFYSIDPGDNQLPILSGSDVAFPHTSQKIGKEIIRISNTIFKLKQIGTYSVEFIISVIANGQLVVTINGVENYSTLVGKISTGSQIIGKFLITTTIPNSTLTIRNPVAGLLPIVIAPALGGILPTTSHLIIIKL